MFVSKTIFTFVIYLSILAGFLSIGNIKKSRKFTAFIHVYLAILFCMFLFQVAALIIVLVFKYSLDDGSGVVCVIAIMVNNSFLIMFYLLRGPKIAQNYSNLANIVEWILSGPVNQEFLLKIKKSSLRVNFLVKLYLISVYVLLVMEFLIKGLSYLKVVDLVTDHSILIYAMPWEVTYYYWPTLIFQTLSTALMTIIQQANHYYLMTMMILQTYCFEYFGKSLAFIISLKEDYSENGDSNDLNLLKTLYKFSYHNGCYQINTQVRKSYRDLNIKVWIKMHNQFISLCKEFVDIYTPLLITYFVVMFVILISGVFSITQNHHYYGVVEEILLGLYFSGIIFNLFLLCIAGSNLNFESMRIFEEAFQAPWYDCSPQVKSCLKIICTVSRRPTRMAAFGSIHFEMSLHTFIWVMRTMASFYMALAQIKRMVKLESGSDNQ